MEGGFRFGRPINPEDPFERGIEAHGNRGREGGPEWEHDLEADHAYWLSYLINPDRLQEIKRFPAHEASSDEWLIYQTLLANLVEKAPEWSPTSRQRLRNLVGLLRFVMYPNLHENEQSSVRKWSNSTTFNVHKLEYEINQDGVEDIQWIWRTFGLNVPKGLSSDLHLEEHIN